jgi:hypothetical protein
MRVFLYRLDAKVAFAGKQAATYRRLASRLMHR